MEKIGTFKHNYVVFFAASSPERAEYGEVRVRRSQKVSDSFRAYPQEGVDGNLDQIASEISDEVQVRLKALVFTYLL